jgi:hypothetical protein
MKHFFLFSFDKPRSVAKTSITFYGVNLQLMGCSASAHGWLRDVQSSAHRGGSFCSTSALTPSRLRSSGKNERQNALVVQDHARSLDHSGV